MRRIYGRLFMLMAFGLIGGMIALAQTPTPAPMTPGTSVMAPGTTFMPGATTMPGPSATLGTATAPGTTMTTPGGAMAPTPDMTAPMGAPTAVAPGMAPSSAQAVAQGTPASTDLTPFLQAEVNEIAVLTAQAQFMQQQGDLLGASLISSYIPDHQAQANRIAALMTANGCNPSLVTANATPVMNCQADIIAADIQAHQQAVNLYRLLLTTACSPEDQRIAALGLNAATRHMMSLSVVQATQMPNVGAMNQSLLAALTLELGAIADIQTQATALCALGDSKDANCIATAIPQHQQQAAALAAMITQIGGNPNAAAPPAPAVALATRDEILSALRNETTQLVNTYAFPVASLPGSPLRVLALQGQNLAIANWGQIAAIYPVCPQPLAAAAPSATAASAAAPSSETPSATAASCTPPAGAVPPSEAPAMMAPAPSMAPAVPAPSNNMMAPSDNTMAPSNNTGSATPL